MTSVLSVKGIYRESIQIWGSHFRQLTLLAFVLEVPLVIAELTVHWTKGIMLSTDDNLALTLVSIPLFSYATLSHHFLSGLCERMVGAVRNGHPEATLREILHDLPWGRLFAADMLLTIAMLVGYAAFIVPGVLVATWFAPLLVLVNLERQPIKASAIRSYRLVRGHFWRVFLTGFAAVFVAGLLTSVSGNIVEQFVHSDAAEALAHAVPATLLMPFGALPIVVMTFDLVELDRKRVAAAAAVVDDASDPTASAGPAAGSPGEPSPVVPEPVDDRSGTGGSGAGPLH